MRDTSFIALVLLLAHIIREFRWVYPHVLDGAGVSYQKAVVNETKELIQVRFTSVLLSGVLRVELKLISCV